MTKEDVMNCLNHAKNGADNRKLLAFCREPKAYSELTRAGVKRELFKVLVDLKNSGAIDFADGKYFSTEQALNLLDSQG
jgi:hypothetical protein